jgi:flagella synthesis protein FlgN
MPSLANIIAAEAGLVSAFVLLLKEEQEALKAANADALPAIVERKTDTVRKLAPVTSARNTELARAGLAPDRAGIDAWLLKYPTDKDVRLQWTKLQTLAAEAKELNRVNGELIRIHMQSNSQALETLLSTNNRQELYSADGLAASATTRRINDSA